MKSRTEEFEALAAFFDPAAVAAVLQDIFDAHSHKSDQSIPALSATATVHDQELLRRLLPQGIYDYWRQSGNPGFYYMSFMLRHAVTVLALAAHELAGARLSINQALENHFRGGAAEKFKVFDFLTTRGQKGTSLSLLGFSALGVHLVYREAGTCRYFDYYASSCCEESLGGLYCREHAAEAWWSDAGPGGSTQAEMFRYYINKENLYSCSERQLEELVSGF